MNGSEAMAPRDVTRGGAAGDVRVGMACNVKVTTDLVHPAADMALRQLYRDEEKYRMYIISFSCWCTINRV